MFRFETHGDRGNTLKSFKNFLKVIDFYVTNVYN